MFEPYIKFKYRELLKYNKKYDNSAIRKRVFIFGNGPSLKMQDISKVSGEDCMTVNYMMLSDLYNIIKPKYHIIVDSDIFDFSEDNYGKMKKENLKGLVNKVCDPYLITLYKFKKEVETIRKEKNIYTIAGSNKIMDLNSRIKFSEIFPLFKNSINFAIYVAIALGYTEIYLLGVDMNKFLIEDIEFDFHVYKYTKEMADRMNKLANSRTNEFLLYSYYEVFKLFRLTRKWAEANNIKIYNATYKGALDVFERINFESIF